MPFVIVRGNLGMANTKVYGLSGSEIDTVGTQLRPGPKDENKDEQTFYNSAVYVMNKLEYFFGYRVIACATQGNEGQPVWTLAKFRAP